MYYEIEPTGCCEAGGLMQIRYCLYLEDGDYGYEKCYISVPTIDDTQLSDIASVQPIDIASVQSSDMQGISSIKPLPVQEQMVNVPFHNHFVYFSPDATDEDIAAQGQRALDEAYAFWSQDQFPDVKNPEITFNPEASDLIKLDISARVESVKVQAVESAAIAASVRVDMAANKISGGKVDATPVQEAKITP